MKKSASTFRCPNVLMIQTKKLELATGLSFADIEQRARIIFIKHLLRQGKRVVPRFTYSAMKGEEKYLGRFLPDPTMEDIKDPRPLF